MSFQQLKPERLWLILEYQALASPLVSCYLMPAQLGNRELNFEVPGVQKTDG